VLRMEDRSNDPSRNWAEGVNDLGRSETSGGGAQLLLQADPEAVAEEGDQDVGFNPLLKPVKDRPQAQLATGQMSLPWRRFSIRYNASTEPWVGSGFLIAAS
jgi:hypothetical protein